ncbi:hypothetical protein PF005_g13962 [Phytophthora fragariae]|uniref:Uncharacterized protein n=2 Tax=Phytophthora TaxID=4783 RepID=A0A6A3TQC5_9STRA|nr:hypothetical protein PF003_g26101 [Phytophthora fragariae]KAE9017588.1 hypothetical protein PR002_g13349 [Phytophthora rubi]KAE8941207.1 hypothetical protein PF009_g8992 [Phytophthora fragariae]KAE9016468.1 hypothetical protein PF011_g7132 [Phytophthora fragariae]KAE9028324.1 hypothetical protein PR001_g11771 [Phytophthora rubi]
MSEGSFFTALERMVTDGNYGDTPYDLTRIKAKLQFGRDRYLSGPFS